MKENLKEKLLAVVNDRCERASDVGTATLSVCDHSGWDKDYWAYRHEIIAKIREKGYNVSVSTSYGVTDIVITEKITL